MDGRFLECCFILCSFHFFSFYSLDNVAVSTDSLSIKSICNCRNVESFESRTVPKQFSVINCFIYVSKKCTICQFYCCDIYPISVIVHCIVYIMDCTWCMVYCTFDILFEIFCRP